jgi:hypothetical protein
MQAERATRRSALPQWRSAFATVAPGIATVAAGHDIDAHAVRVREGALNADAIAAEHW